VKPTIALAVILASGLCLSGETPKADKSSEDSVTIRYLGASGLSIRHGSDHILTAPFFSNPGIWRVLFGRIASDESRFPEDIDELASDAVGILVGHAHYDHLLDVPGVARRMPRSARIYGNETAAHILAAVPDLRGRVVVLNDSAGDSERPGDWIWVVGSAIRFMPLRSGHAPHYAGMRIFDGGYTEDLTRLPPRAKGWPLGLPLSFVIDFLDPGSREPVFRIYYQDAAADPPQGFPPPLGDGKEFDLAVLCVASFEGVEEHPEAVLRWVEPRAVLLTHWEGFFRPQSEPVRPVRATDLEEFIERFEAAIPEHTPHWMPSPGEAIAIPLSPP